MASLLLPSWLPGPVDAGAQVLSGIRVGSQIQQEQARLAQEASLTQMRLMLQQQEDERANALRQQEMAQTQAYNTAQIGLRQKELEEQKRVNEIKVQESARLFQAQQGFQQWMAANPDKDPAEGILKFFPGTDAGSMAGYGTLARSLFEGRQKLGPPEVVNEAVDGENIPFLRIPERGGAYRMQQIRRPSEDIEGRQMRQEQRRELERRRDKLEASMTDVERLALDNPSAPLYKVAKAKQDQIDAIDRQLEAAYSGSGLATPAPTSAPEVIRSWNPQTQQWEGGSPTAAPAPGDVAPLPFTPSPGIAPAPVGAPAGRPWEGSQQLSPVPLPPSVSSAGAFRPQMPSLPSTLGTAGQMGQSMLPAYAGAFQGLQNVINIPAQLRALRPVGTLAGQGFQNLINPFVQQQPPIPQQQ